MHADGSRETTCSRHMVMPFVVACLPIRPVVPIAALPSYSALKVLNPNSETLPLSVSI